MTLFRYNTSGKKINPYIQFTRQPVISSGWTPDNLGNLALWFESDSGITLNGATVSSWQDKKSGISVSQSVSLSQPYYKSNVFNGLPALKFDGVDDFMMKHPPWGVPSTNVITMYFVISGAVGFASKSTVLFDGGYTSGIYSTPNFINWGGAAQHPGWTAQGNGQSGQVLYVESASGSVRRYAGAAQVTGSGKVWTVYKNGVTASATTTSTIPSAIASFHTSSAIQLGGYCPPLNQNFTSDMALGAFLVFTAQHTAAEIAQVDAYLSAKFGGV